MAISLSPQAILKELSYYDIATGGNVSEFLEAADELVSNVDLSKPEYNKVVKRLKLDILDIEKFVKVNNCKCVTNARAFSGNGIPDPEGLLSNEIFGFTMSERKGTFAYIDLHGWFMDPSCYKTWSRLDSRVKNIVHGIKYYRITPDGLFIEDEEKGETGVEFLRKNIKRIKFKPTDAKSKQISIQYLEMNRDRMFINKFIVIPPFYRDKNTSSNSRATVGLGGVNKLYTNLIVSANALTATQEFGFDASDAMSGRVQEIILNIYDWFAGNSNESLKNDTAVGMGQGLSGKLGVLRRTGMSKTSNFSSRLVISANDLKVDTPDDLMVTLDKSAVPLYSVITEFRDFVMYHTRLFFENEFRGAQTYPVLDKNGKAKVIVPKDPEITFSDERIKKEMDRFLHGYNNRFVPIEIPVEESNQVYYMQFKGRGVSVDESKVSENPVANRRLTWCDVFFIASVEATKDKQVLITRFPIDFFSNQITTGVEVSSTKETEKIEMNGEVYRFYPKIREEDIGTDTSNRFVDTLRFGNYYLSGMGGDYDGDQVTCKGVYTREANDELRSFMNSKQNFITFGCAPLREPGADVYQSIFALTRVLSSTKITDSNSIMFK